MTHPETLFEQLFYTTVLIETTAQDGSQSVGTGFIYNIETSDTESAAFIVTNRHVVEGAKDVKARLIASVDARRTAPDVGKPHYISVAASQITLHPDPAIDVAVIPFTPFVTLMQAAGRHVFFRSIASVTAMTRANQADLDALEEVIFIGYPNGLYDSVTFLPIARRGSTATPPAVDYGGKPIFLIDASVFPGSSGSPVFIAQTGGFATKKGDFQIGGRLIWLGIVAAVYQRHVPVLSIPTNAQSFVADTINVGVVYKAECVDEVVDSVLRAAGLQRHVRQPLEAVVDPTMTGNATLPLEGTAISE